MIENCALLRRHAALRITNCGRLMKVADIPSLSYTWALTQLRKESTCSLGAEGGSWDLVGIGLKTHAKGESQPVHCDLQVTVCLCLACLGFLSILAWVVMWTLCVLPPGMNLWPTRSSKSKIPMIRMSCPSQREDTTFLVINCVFLKRSFTRYLLIQVGS